MTDKGCGAGPVDEASLLEMLNSTPVVDGAQQDLFAADDALAAWARGLGGTGGPEERALLRLTRDGLQRVVRGDGGEDVLRDVLRGAARVPEVAAHGVVWRLVTAPDALLPTRLVLAWARVLEESPGRLRPCANEECRRFLLDRSRANRARWCSMAVCGNRMKARRHYERSRHAG